MNWGFIEIPGTEEDKQVIESVRENFGNLHMVSGAHVDAALFRGPSATQRPYQLYLTPKAMEITGSKLAGYVAKKCSKPTELGPLLSGDQRIIEKVKSKV